uniref:Uncharacterized protein n=1 Tax=Salix viminalis TaxID=40686 RepID=A0A6N2KX74_SALVM
MHTESSEQACIKLGRKGKRGRNATSYSTNDMSLLIFPVNFGKKRSSEFARFSENECGGT